ncbi:hypothetical protein ABIF90_003249 [Bradyrhizobium japonicum]
MPEKSEEFELLIGDHRSLRRLADQTLNNENVVTPENATELLEAMRQATIAEEKKAFEQDLERERAKHRQARAAQGREARQARSDAAIAVTQRDSAIEAVRALRTQRVDSVHSISRWTTKTVRKFDMLGTALILLVALCIIVNSITGWLAAFPFWTIGVGAILGLFAVYHGVMNALGKPKIGLATLLNGLSRMLFRHRIANAGLTDLIDFDAVKYESGAITVPPEAIR